MKKRIIFVLALILIIFIIGHGHNDAKYKPGAYFSTILLNNQTIDVKVVVDEKNIKEISLNNLDETDSAIYPLMEPALDNISQQIYDKQSTEGITYEESYQYTSVVLLDAIKDALSKAET